MPYELKYQVFGRDDRIVTRRKGFRTEKAMRAFILKLEAASNFYCILAYSGPRG